MGVSIAIRESGVVRDSVEFGVQNCAKSLNSNNSTINQMSYIQQFFSQHLEEYYLSVLRRSITRSDFVDFNNLNNIFTLTFDLILTGAGTAKGAARWSEELIHRLLWISYESLQQVNLLINEGDGQIVRMMKQNMKYVHNQMLQLFLRLLLAFIQSGQAECLSNTTLKCVQEISYIYPALKTQISINHDQINLPAWFEKYLSQLRNIKPFNTIFIQVLNKIKQQCHFIGPMEKVIQQFTGVTRAESVKSQRHFQIYAKKSEYSSVTPFSQIRFESTEKKRPQDFDDMQIFRRKKKRIIKQKFKPNNENGAHTPIREKDHIRHTPKTEKTQNFRSMFQQKSEASKPASPLFKTVMMMKSKKPLERTLYHGAIKKFVPKKITNPQEFIQNITSSAYTCQSIPVLQLTRKTEKKYRNLDFYEGEINAFCVPETPKQEQIVRVVAPQKRSSSMDMNRTLSGCLI